MRGIKRMECICGCETVLTSTNYKMVALEKPYMNLFFFKGCLEQILNEIGGWDQLGLYLAKNLDMWYNRSVK